MHQWKPSKSTSFTALLACSLTRSLARSLNTGSPDKIFTTRYAVRKLSAFNSALLLPLLPLIVAPQAAAANSLKFAAIRILLLGFYERVNPTRVFALSFSRFLGFSSFIILSSLAIFPPPIFKPQYINSTFSNNKIIIIIIVENT